MPHSVSPPRPLTGPQVFTIYPTRNPPKQISLHFSAWPSISARAFAKPSWVSPFVGVRGGWRPSKSEGKEGNRRVEKKEKRPPYPYQYVSTRVVMSLSTVYISAYPNNTVVSRLTLIFSSSPNPAPPQPAPPRIVCDGPSSRLLGESSRRSPSQLNLDLKSPSVYLFRTDSEVGEREKLN